MQKIFLLIIIIAFNSCKEAPDNQVISYDIEMKYVYDTAKVVDNFVQESSEYATYYMAIADTGVNYYTLDKKMYELSRSLKLSIDTMNRHHDKAKNNIVVSDNDEDEMYRGEYYPRRGPDEHLSLEYLSFFDSSADPKTIVLLAGIYDNTSGADSMVAILRKEMPGAYALKGRIYVGCMH